VAQSFSRINIHLIFSTKNREPILGDDVRQDLHSYMATVLNNLESPCVLINSVPDHVHVLFEISRKLALSHAVEDIKKTSSKWIKTQRAAYSSFAWQAGYGAFAVSESNVADVRRYIEEQREHHRKLSFQEEFLAFLKRHNVRYDERYI
jgi:REP element-mobilizing transposase RayT